MDKAKLAEREAELEQYERKEAELAEKAAADELGGWLLIFDSIHVFSSCELFGQGNQRYGGAFGKS